jgi:dUTPase
MVIQKVYQGQYEIVGDLEETERNEGGFGHTGVYRLRILE